MWQMSEHDLFFRIIFLFSVLV